MLQFITNALPCVRKLPKEINGLDIGIQVVKRKFSLLAYADDICLVANREDNLKQMFNCVGLNIFIS